MTPEEYLKAGQINEALAGLQEAVRKAPADAKLRRFLFQLHCVTGRWEKALTQLQVVSEMDDESALLAQIFQPVIACETLRAEVFQGKRTALIFGEPESWVGEFVQASALASQGQFKAAQELQTKALEAAPAVAGRVGEEPFEWIADADTRLGPLFEAFIDAKYYWIPATRILELEIEPPSDLRDLVWTPVRFKWVNGGFSQGFVPVRYPGSEASSDGAILLARKTEWIDKPEGQYFGLGQRTFATNEGDHPMLQVRKIVFANTPAAPEVEPAAESLAAE